MSKLQELFEKYYSNKIFVTFIVLFHGAFVVSLLLFSQKEERPIIADGLFIAGVVVITFYWKFFAKMKKKEHEKR